MKIKRSFLNLILSCLLTLFVFQQGFSKEAYAIHSNDPLEANSFENESPLFNLNNNIKSKLTESKKEVKRTYQNSLDSFPPGLSTVQTDVYLTSKTESLLMDVETVHELENLLKYVNGERDRILLNIRNDINLQTNILYSMYDIKKAKHKRDMNSKIREAKAHLLWPILLLISIGLLILSASRDLNLLKITSLVILVVSILATVYFSSDYIFLMEIAEYKSNIQTEELKEILLSDYQISKR